MHLLIKKILSEIIEYIAMFIIIAIFIFIILTSISDWQAAQQRNRSSNDESQTIYRCCLDYTGWTIKRNGQPVYFYRK